MKKTILYSFWVVCILVLPVFLTAQEENESTNAPKYSNEFLQIGVGARALGLGNALVAGVNDVTAGYWNPAGLMHVENNLEFALMHSEYFAGIAKYDYLGVAHRLDEQSVVGFSVLRFGVDDIPNTTQLINNEGNIDYDRITLFAAADYAFLFSYSRGLSAIEGLNVGANVKIVHRRAGDFARAWGFGFDAGAQYNFNNWEFGAMMRDITATPNSWFFNLDAQMQEVFIETGNEIPENGVEFTLPRMILAGRRKMNIGEKGIHIAPEVNAVITTDGMRNTLLKSNLFSIDPVFGLEVGYQELVAIRAGVNNFQYLKNFDGTDYLTFQPNIGLGVTLKGVTLDYAFTNIGNQSDAVFSHVISLKFGFKEPFKKDETTR